MEQAQDKWISLRLSDEKLELLKTVSKRIAAAPKAVNARRSCPKCHGTGRIGYLNGNRLLPVPCAKCARRTK